MASFDEDRPELTGSLISMEFGAGGRISQLWASDPSLAEEGEEFQFILPPIQFGEESADDYLPGTILIGARTNPSDPWALSRSTVHSSEMEQDLDADNFDPSRVDFEYEFPLLPEIQATGKYYEIPGPTPQICWEITIRNAGRVSIEIGELGFPMAFNNFYDGFGWTDEQLTKLWNSRVYLHKFIGGAASWLFAQRMTAEPPGLLVFPGDDTGWEFISHVRASLNTPYQWEGIPVVYIHSRATVEREHWEDWMNGHTSLILEPGDSRTFQIRFVPCDSDRQDGVSQTLVACGKAAIKVLPSCVAPVDVGIGIEVTGVVPSRFSLSRAALFETDVDDESAFCFVKAAEPGPLQISFRDKSGGLCQMHLMFTEPIRELVHRRSDWIAKYQVVDQVDSPLHRAIVVTNIATREQGIDPGEYMESSGIECSLADALFLAEKNAIYPDAAQIQVLDQYVKEFLMDDLQNPASHAVGSILSPPGGIGAYFGRPLGYPHVISLYHSLSRIARHYGGLSFTAEELLRHAYRTAIAMFEHGWRLYVRTVGVLGYARIYELLDDLRADGLQEEAAELEGFVQFKAKELTKMKHPYAGESVMDTSGMEEVFMAARYLHADDHLERTVRCAFAARSLSPSWWWYGVDKRSWDGADSSPLKALVDRGESCLAHTTIPNSLIFFELMDRDYLAIPETYMRSAFGGMLGPWALVRSDGAASMCFCPDWASKQAGFNVYTGASGLGYFHYLRGAGCFILPNRGQMFIFGGHYDATDEAHIIQPWDGVGRRIVLRQIGVEFKLNFGCISLLKLDTRLRWFEAKVENPGDREAQARLEVTGLWGSKIEVDGEVLEAHKGRLSIPLTLGPNQVTTVSGKVVT